jgi:hypothetical protein
MAKTPSKAARSREIEPFDKRKIVPLKAGALGEGAPEAHQPIVIFPFCRSKH